MVIEIATIYVKEEAEVEFVTDFAKGLEVLNRQPGCQGLRWWKRVEPELAYVLEVEWTNIEDHFNFRGTEDYVTFGGFFRQYLSQPPEVVHFEPDN